MELHPLAELFPPLSAAALQELAEDIAQNGLKEPIWTLEGRILDGRNRWNACKIANVECKAVEYQGDDPLGFVLSLNLRRRQLTPSQLAMIGVEIEAHRSREAGERKAERCRRAASLRARDSKGRLVPKARQQPPHAFEGGMLEVSNESSALIHTSSAIAGSHCSAERRPSRLHTTERGAESARQAARHLGVNHDYISKAKRVVRDAPELAGLVKSGELKLQHAVQLAKLPQPHREQMLSKLRGSEAVGEALGRTTAWVPHEQLHRLRSCFMKVLRRYIEKSKGDFASLVACMDELQAELVGAQRSWDVGRRGGKLMVDQEMGERTSLRAGGNSPDTANDGTTGGALLSDTNTTQ